MSPASDLPSPAAAPSAGPTGAGVADGAGTAEGSSDVASALGDVRSRATSVVEVAAPAGRLAAGGRYRT